LTLGPRNAVHATRGSLRGKSVAPLRIEDDSSTALSSTWDFCGALGYRVRLLNAFERDMPDKDAEPADSVLVRHYEPRDREQVRAIACETGDAGSPFDEIFSDCGVLADVLTRYYTDFEPQSAWVAEYEGRVVGYIIGSIRPNKYNAVMSWLVFPAAVLRGIGRGALWRRESWRIIGAGLAGFLPGVITANRGLGRYPAHLHINVSGEFRGERIGERLMQQFEDRVRAAGLKGIHARVRGDNAGARRFFERLGYLPLIVSKPVTLYYHDDSSVTFNLVTYVKKL